MCCASRKEGVARIGCAYLPPHTAPTIMGRGGRSNSAGCCSQGPPNHCKYCNSTRKFCGGLGCCGVVR